MAGNTSKISLEISNLKKEFDRRPVFKDLNFSLTNSDSLAITGKNGSGKSTLIKVLANVYAQTAGNITFSIDGKTVERQNVYQHIGFVSPYLNLYDEFTGYENLHFVTRLRNLDISLIDETLSRIGLFDRRHDLVKIYSSGMKQRLKFVFALMHSPGLLILDEPTSNLDDEGKDAVYKMIAEEGGKNIVVIASNEERDLQICSEIIKLEYFSNN